MPSSRPNSIPYVATAIRTLQPTSILDIGVGFGKWGVLFREYTDIVQSENDPERYARHGWKVKIDGIEGHEEYLTDLHRFIYDQVHIGDAAKVLGSIGEYDIVFLGDVIEHFTKQDGIRVLDLCLRCAQTAVIVTTPATPTRQGALCGNSYEIHRSEWSPSDFATRDNWTTALIEGDMLLAANMVDSRQFTWECSLAQRKQSVVNKLRVWLGKARRRASPSS